MWVLVFPRENRHLKRLEQRRQGLDTLGHVGGGFVYRFVEWGVTRFDRKRQFPELCRLIADYHFRDAVQPAPQIPIRIQVLAGFPRGN